MHYVNQNISHFDSIESFSSFSSNSFGSYFHNINIEEVFSIGNFFLLAEPGFGKSRLLKELFGLKKPKHSMAYLHLNNIKEHDEIDDCIFKNSEFYVPTLSFSDLLYSSVLRTENFDFENDMDGFVFFDGLDEVKGYALFNVLTKISVFIKKYPNVKVGIACRSHIFQRYTNEISILKNFSYLKIHEFDLKGVNVFLSENNNFSENEINDIIEHFDTLNQISIIQTPRYLSNLSNLFKSRGFHNVMNMTRSELFDKFIYDDLERNVQDRKSEMNVDVVKRVLEKVALVMQIHQTNSISKDEFLTVLDEVKSNFVGCFISSFYDFNLFYENGLLKNKGDHVEFLNVEFKEFLASKELIRLGKLDQILYELAYDKNINSFYPHWYNTICFVIDSMPEMVEVILNFSSNKFDELQLKQFHSLLIRSDISRISMVTKNRIFEDIFNYYQNNLLWFPYDLCRGLVKFFSHSNFDFIMRTIDETIYKNVDELEIRRANVAHLIGSLFSERKGSEILTNEQTEASIDLLLKFSNCDIVNGVLQRDTLVSLGYANKDDHLILLKQKFFDSDDERFIESFVIGCSLIKPQNEFTIKVILEGFIKDIAYASMILGQIKNPKDLDILLEHLLINLDFLIKIIKDEEKFTDLLTLIKSFMEKNMDLELVNKIESLFFSITDLNSYSQYPLLHSEFFSYLFGILLTQKKEFIHRFFEKNNARKFEEFIPLFVKHLGSFDPNDFLNKLHLLDKTNELSLYFLKSSKKLLPLFETTFPVEYEKYQITISRVLENSSKTTKENDFKQKLFSEKFGNNYASLKMLNSDSGFDEFVRINPDVLDRVRKVILTFLDNIQTNQFTLKLTSKNDDMKTYSIHSHVPIFSICTSLCAKFDFEVEKFRKKFLDFIPYSSENELNNIFKIVKNITSREIDYMLKIYSEIEQNDLAMYMPKNFIEASKRTHMVEAIPILKVFVENINMYDYLRISSLETICELTQDFPYIQQIFDRYKDSTLSSEQEICNTANELLIINFNDVEAIKWRFEKLKENAVVSKNHDFLIHGSDFYLPLNSIDNPEHIDLFLDLLNFSFSLLDKDKDYYDFSSHLWDIVFKYFDRLKLYKNYKYLNKLESFMKNIPKDTYGYNWFSESLIQLKINFSNVLGKSKTIYESIKKYNEVKEKQYLNISSSYDLFQLCIDIVNDDLKTWVEEEGAYRFINQVSGSQEDLIQKTLKTKIEYSFSSRGFTVKDVKVKREEQLLDDKRLDFTINYGFIGSIVFEIKRFANKEVYNDSERVIYKDKMIQYIKGSNSDYAIYLLFQDEDKYTMNELLPKVKEVYNDYDNIEVMGLNCILGKKTEKQTLKKCKTCNNDKSIEDFSSPKAMKCNDCKKIKNQKI